MISDGTGMDLPSAIGRSGWGWWREFSLPIVPTQDDVISAKLSRQLGHIVTDPLVAILAELIRRCVLTRHHRHQAHHHAYMKKSSRRNTQGKVGDGDVPSSRTPYSLAPRPSDLNQAAWGSDTASPSRCQGSRGSGGHRRVWLATHTS